MYNEGAGSDLQGSGATVEEHHLESLAHRRPVSGTLVCLTPDIITGQRFPALAAIFVAG